MAAEQHRRLGGDEDREDRVDEQHRHQPLEAVRGRRARPPGTAETSGGLRARYAAARVAPPTKHPVKARCTNVVEGQVGHELVDPAGRRPRRRRRTASRRPAPRPSRPQRRSGARGVRGPMPATPRSCGRATAGRAARTSGHAIPASTNPSSRRPPVTPATRQAVPASRHRATIHPASSSSDRQRAAAPPAPGTATVNGSRRRFAAHQHGRRRRRAARGRTPGRGRGTGSAARPSTPSRRGQHDGPARAGRVGPEAGRRAGRATGGTSTAVGAGAGAGCGHGGLRDGGRVPGPGRRPALAAGRAGSSRRSTAPVVPAGGSTKRTVPPCSVATQRAMASPRPVPPAAVLSGRGGVPNRSKTRSRSPAARPDRRRRPRATSAPSVRRSARTRTVPSVGAVPDGVVEQVDEQLAQPGPVGRAP